MDVGFEFENGVWRWSHGDRKGVCRQTGGRSESDRTGPRLLFTVVVAGDIDTGRSAANTSECGEPEHPEKAAVREVVEEERNRFRSRSAASDLGSWKHGRPPTCWPGPWT